MPTRWLLLDNTLHCVPPPSSSTPPPACHPPPLSSSPAHSEPLLALFPSTMQLVWKPNKLRPSPDLIKRSSLTISAEWKGPQRGVSVGSNRGDCLQISNEIGCALRKAFKKGERPFSCLVWEATEGHMLENISREMLVHILGDMLQWGFWNLHGCIICERMELYFMYTYLVAKVVTVPSKYMWSFLSV